jgi:hypothetical protein
MELAFSKEEFTKVNRLAMTLIVEVARFSSIDSCYDSVMNALNQSRSVINASLDRKYYGQVFGQCIHLLETLERYYPKGLQDEWIVRLLERVFRETPEHILVEQLKMRIEHLRS